MLIFQHIRSNSEAARQIWSFLENSTTSVTSSSLLKKDDLTQGHFQSNYPEIIYQKFFQQNFDFFFWKFDKLSIVSSQLMQGQMILFKHLSKQMVVMKILK